MGKQILTAERVTAVFNGCLFKETEDKSNPVIAEGITLSVGFHPGRLNSSRGEIEKLLNELPDEFKSSGGGGWSFLNACNDKHGNQWTGLHRTMEMLFLLGIAIGKVESQLPREMWSVLPGGVPYYIVKM
jgi:hypothetical protein